MSRIILAIVLCLALVASSSAAAAAPEFGATVRALGGDDAKAQKAAIEAVASSGAPRALEVLRALRDQRLRRADDGSLLIESAAGLRDAVSGAPAAGMPTKPIQLNNLTRRALDGALAELQLASPERAIRLAAAKELAEFPDAETADMLRPYVEREDDQGVRVVLALAVAKVDIKSDDRDRRLAAVNAIRVANDVSMEADLAALVEPGSDGSLGEPDPEVRREMTAVLKQIRFRVLVLNGIANLIYGLSLGSVLLLAALGLAITFGLMRVINMAHGEMLMIGAYATFVVRTVFLERLPGLADWYLVAAVPVAFLVSGGVGVLLERTVIRFLYGRPLETLLATWGLSLVLIQAVRSYFGAQNVTVANPEWLSGGWELFPSLILPYSRVAVLIFTAVVVTFVWFVLTRTSLGLKVRAVTQNRDMAASLGIATHRVDMWTFGLGSGLAGLGGVALSQLGNVGPELGQSHIIDSFMVVVLGGVGNVLGTIVAALGLGIANKVLEPSTGAVLGKILLLALLILFIQWRPQGIFALKGRAAEA